MSKRGKAARAKAKAKRARAAARPRWLRRWPYLLFGAFAVVLVAVLFFVSVGGGSSKQAQASYPPGYTPPTLGSESAPVELVIWADFQCPFCNRFEQRTLPQIKERYIDTGKLKFVWRNFENYGSESHDAAVAAYCAREQGKWWEYHDALYDNQRGINQGAFSKGNLQRFAEQIGLDMAAFNTCVDGISFDSVTAADKQVGRSEFSVNATPTFFLNGLRIVGAQPTDTFVSAIEEALARAGQSPE